MIHQPLWRGNWRNKQVFFQAIVELITAVVVVPIPAITNAGVGKEKAYKRAKIRHQHQFQAGISFPYLNAVPKCYISTGGAEDVIFIFNQSARCASLYRATRGRRIHGTLRADRLDKNYIWNAKLYPCLVCLIVPSAVMIISVFFSNWMLDMLYLRPVKEN